MTPAERLLIALRTLNIRIRVDGGTIRCTAARGPIPSDLAQQIRDLKPQLLDLLLAEERAIASRIESLGGDLLGAGGDRSPGVCAWCGAAMPVQPSSKCTRCCLAAAHVLDQRWQKERATYPNMSKVGDHDQTGNESEAAGRDMSPVGKEAA